MSRMKSVMETINETVGEINSRYDLTLLRANEIYDNSGDKFTPAYNGFVYGYAQGVKAAKAEARKKSVLSASQKEGSK